MPKPAYERIMANVVVDDNGCWLWKGTKDGRGYGRISLYRLGKKVVKERTHRIMYMAVHGPIPNDMVVRHKCDVKACCNPYHLELGTKSDNAYDYYNRQRQAAHTDSADSHTGIEVDEEGLVIPPF